MKTICYGMLGGALCAEFLGVDIASGGDEAADANPITPAENTGDSGADDPVDPASVDAGSDKVEAVDQEPVSWEDAAAEYIPPAPEGLGADEWNSAVNDLAKAAHELGVSKEVFSKLVDAHLERDSQVEEARENAVKDGIAELRGDWGAEYPIKVQAAVGALEKYAKKAGVDFAVISKDPAFTMNVPLMKILAAMAGDIGGKHVAVSGAAGAAGGDGEAERIMSDPSHPQHAAYMDVNHHGHKAANARVNVLMGIK